MKNFKGLLFFILFIGLTSLGWMGMRPAEKVNLPGWPKITNETKPWSRWWWMGSAVDDTNLTRLIANYGNAGFGGLEITPIYGAVGYESRYLSYLSPEWMKMLDVSVREAQKNSMGIDMNTGTGWPFGGPQIPQQLAASKLILQKYSVKGGAKFFGKIIISDPKQLEAGAKLQALTAYGEKGKIKDLTLLVNENGTVNWTPENGNWDIYAAFSGKTLQKVKRAAPGGEGWTFDHFSKDATIKYLSRFDTTGRTTEPLTIVSGDGVGTLFIPAGTILLDAAGNRLTGITLYTYSDSTNPVSMTIMALPSGATFNPPITLTFHFDKSQVSADEVQDLNVYVQLSDGDRKSVV